MALLREWFELKKERAFPKKFPYQVIIAVAGFALLMAVFNLPEKNYRIYDGAVSEETGTVFLSAHAQAILTIDLLSESQLRFQM